MESSCVPTSPRNVLGWSFWKQSSCFWNHAAVGLREIWTWVLGRAEALAYCSDFSQLNFKKERRTGLQVTPVAYLLPSKPGHVGFSIPCLSQGQGRHSRSKRGDGKVMMRLRTRWVQHKMVNYVQRLSLQCSSFSHWFNFKFSPEDWCFFFFYFGWHLITLVSVTGWQVSLEDQVRSHETEWIHWADFRK